MSDLRKTAKHSFIYAGGVFLGRAVSFVMLPIYTRFLTPADYGVLELVGLTIDIAGMIVGFGLTTAVFRFYYAERDDEGRGAAVSTIALLLIGLYFVGASIGFASSGWLARLVLSGTPEQVSFFRLMFLALFLQSFVDVPLAYIQAQQRSKVFVLWNTAKLVVQLSLNIVFVVVMRLGVLGVLLSTVLSFALIGAGLVVRTFRSAGLHFSAARAREMLRFGAPFVVANLGAFVLTFSDRYFLKAYADLGAVGIYALGYKMGFLLWAFAVAPVMSIWEAQRFELANRGAEKEATKRLFLTFNTVLMFVALGMTLFARDVFRLMSDAAFWDAYRVVPVVLAAYIVQAWTALCNFGVLYAKETKHLARGAVWSAVLIIALSFALIPTFGGMGAAWATLLAFVLRFWIVYRASQRLWPLDYAWGRVLPLCGLAALFVAPVYLVSIESVPLSLAFDAFVMLAFVATASALPSVGGDFRAAALLVLKKRQKAFRFGE